MVRAIIVAAFICVAAVVLAAAQEENGFGSIQWCSKTTYCKDGLHCCTTTTCCPNNRYCCGSGKLCCSFTNSLLTPDAIPAIESFEE